MVFGRVNDRHKKKRHGSVLQGGKSYDPRLRGACIQITFAVIQEKQRGVKSGCSSFCRMADYFLRSFSGNRYIRDESTHPVLRARCSYRERRHIPRSQGCVHHRQGTQKYPQPIFSPVSLHYSHGSAGLAAQTLHPRRSGSLLRRVRRQAWRLLEHDRDDVMRALQNAYWMAKKRNKETYASKK